MNKRVITVLFAIALAGAAYCVDPAILRTPVNAVAALFITDASTGKVSAVTSANPLPVSATISVTQPAVTKGIIKQSIISLSNGSVNKLADFASGTTAPFYLNVSITGTTSARRVPITGSTATDSCTVMNVGDFIHVYVSTNTPDIGLTAPSTGAATSCAELWQ